MLDRCFSGCSIPHCPLVRTWQSKPSCSHQDMEWGVLITEDRAGFWHIWDAIEWGGALFICHLCLHWPQLSWCLPFSEIILSASISLLLLDHQPQVPAFGKEENISFLLLVKDIFPCSLSWALLHEASTSSVVFPVHTWSLYTKLCGLEIITGQTSIPPQPSTDASRGAAWKVELAGPCPSASICHCSSWYGAQHVLMCLTIFT